MAYEVKRKIFKTGHSICVALPPIWLQSRKISEVTLIYNDLIIIAPLGLEEKARKMLEYAGRVKR